MDKQLQHKLFNYEEKPNTKIWADIVDALDDQTSEVSKKLFQLETIPSSNNWNKIALSLDSNTETIVVPFYKRYRNTIKSINAVAAIVLLIFTVTLIINRGSVSGELSNQQNNPASNQQIIDKNDDSDVTTRINNTEEDIEKDISILRRSHSYASGILLKNKVQKLKPLGARPRIHASSIISELKTSIVNNNLLDKYIVIPSADGKAVKLPKKIYDKVSCAKDAVDYEKACKEALANLQNKIATQISATDFTGLIDILQNLQENQ